MVVVHDVFVCKPGNASKMAKLFKEVMTGPTGQVPRIMTDMTGQYNRVIMVTEFENLTAYENMMKEYMNPSEKMKQQMAKMQGYTDLYITGSREIYQTW